MRTNLNHFFWKKNDRTLSCSISDIDKGIGRIPSAITVFNENTKQERTFKYVKVERDAEGEDCVYHFICPEYNLKMIVFND